MLTTVHVRAEQEPNGDYLLNPQSLCRAWQAVGASNEADRLMIYAAVKAYVLNLLEIERKHLSAVDHQGL